MNEIQKVFSSITVDEVKPHTYKGNKGVHSAQLRQTVTTTYPSVRVGNSKTKSLFDSKDFNLADGQSYTSQRITWIDVPEGTTVNEINDLLAKAPKAVIYRIISFNVQDVMTDEQRQAVAAGLTTMETFIEKLRVRRLADNGTVVDIDGPPQYSQNFFNKDGCEDIDFRGDGLPAEEVVTQQQEDTAVVQPRELVI